MGMKSKRKGRVGELSAAKFLCDHGFPARRGRQYSGDPSAPDVICDSLPFHIEVKRTETLSLYPVMEKAQQDAGDQPAVIFHRKNKKPWLTILSSTDFLNLIKRLQQ